jgi:hypothetical protein
MVLVFPETIELLKGYSQTGAGETPDHRRCTGWYVMLSLLEKRLYSLPLVPQGWKFDYINLIIGCHFITRFHNNGKERNESITPLFGKYFGTIELCSSRLIYAIFQNAPPRI